MTVNVSKPVVNVREKLAELDKPTGVAGEAMLRAETPQEQFNLIGAGRRNLLINGGFDVWQRGTSVSQGGSNSYHTADRWYQYSGQSSFARSTDVPEKQGFVYSVVASNFTSNLVMDTGVELPVAGNPWVFHEGSTFTLSFWAKATSYSGRLMARGVFRQNSGSSSNEVSPSGFYDHSKSLALSSEWQKHSITYTMPSISLGSGIKGFFLSFRTTDGTSLDAPSSSASIYITGVQLELGKVATPFEHRSYGEELALCQRYYYKSGGVYQAGYVYSPNNSVDGMRTSWNFPVTMRSNPTTSISGGSDGGSQATIEIIADSENSATVNLRSTNSSYEVWWQGGTITADAEL